VKLGIHLPQWGADATREGVLAVARAAEEAGLHSVWVADHIVHPLTTGSVYPYRGGGVPFGPEEGFLEAFSTLALVAGATERVRLGTSVLILPMRDPLLTAKVVATLDVLSHGRVELGIGAGWWAEEFSAVSAPFAGRGARLDEQIDVIRRLWSGERTSYAGGFYSFDPVTCRPSPVQCGGPPILIGGMNQHAHRRAVRLGDGWHAVGADPDKIRQGREAIARLCEDAGRDPASILVSTSTGFGRDSGRALSRLEALGEAGVELAVLNIGENTAAAAVAAIGRIATEVMPCLG
jgi:probable F420-dependent oxidoreductase